MIITLTISLIASILTYYLGSYPKVGKIRASSGLTLLFILFLSLGKSSYGLINLNYEYVFLGGTFVGMNDKKNLSIREIVIASIAFAVLYEYFFIKLSGPGGILGFLAFVPSIFIYYLFKYVRK